MSTTATVTYPTADGTEGEYDARLSITSATAHYEILAHRKGWPASQDAPLLCAMFAAWRAVKADVNAPTELRTEKFEDFLQKDIDLDLSDLDAAAASDPTQPDL